MIRALFNQRGGPAYSAVLALLILASAARAQTPAPVAPAAPVYPPDSPYHSVFVDDVNFGKDPFFPKSKRRIPKTPVVEVKPMEMAVEGLELKGVSGMNPNRLAIINNRTFAAGEELPVKVRDQRVPVKCLEIREDSVLISVEGTVRELHFKRKL